MIVRLLIFVSRKRRGKGDNRTESKAFIGRVIEVVK